ncbi:type I secretion system permease/ATPase [Pseudoteredinibacter isoporae]|uniref:type I secretion system permease/ATPase n=1 Tax=Pseudoteredinibacter isoporae TaxID=570281 RepID=UPI00310872B0
MEPRSLVRTAYDGLKKSLVYVFLFSFCVNLLLLVPPIYMLQLYSQVISTNNLDALLAFTAVALSLMLCMAFFDWVRSQMLIRLGNHFEDGLLESLYRCNVSQKADSIEADNRVNGISELESIKRFITGPNITAFFDVPWIPVFLIALFAFHFFIGLFALTCVLLLLVIAFANEYLSRSVQLHDSESSRLLQSNLRNSDAALAMGMLPALARRWKETRRSQSLKTAELDIYTSSFSIASKHLRLIAQLAILGLGAYLLIQQELTLGLMIVSSILLGRSLAPIEQVVRSWSTFVQVRRNFRLLDRALQRNPERTNADGSLANDLPYTMGNIYARDVAIAAPGSELMTLRNVHFQLTPGTVTAIIGESGVGKSSLLKSIVGIWPVREGRLRLDHMEMSSCDEVLRQNLIGYLPQDVQLFDGSIAENIARFSTPEPAKVIKAAREAGLHSLILRLPRGYETPIGAEGMPLSGGQKQRIALARALYHEPQIVVLDEPNANLDRFGEQCLHRAIKNLKEKGKIVVLATHRQSILRHVDQLLTISDGQIKASIADERPRMEECASEWEHA